MSDLILSLKSIALSYGQGRSLVEVFSNLNFDVFAGETIGLVGPSGCGKSSLLHIAGLLEPPQKGHIFLHGKDVASLTEEESNHIRMTKIGFVFQMHHLLPEFSALDNVALAAMIMGQAKKHARARAGELLDAIGLGERLDHRPSEMSGGERQRVAIARAMINNPSVMIADEPTGNLDPNTAKLVFSSLLNLLELEKSDSQRAVIIATHNFELAREMDRVLDLTDGLLKEREDF